MKRQSTAAPGTKRTAKSWLMLVPPAAFSSGKHCTGPSMKQAMKLHPELADMFEEALLECRDQMLEILVEIDTKDPRTPYGSTDPKMAAVISKNIMWVLEKMWPEKFVQRLRVETGRSDEVIIAALQTAQMGMALSRQPVALPLPLTLPAPVVVDAIVIPPELEGLV